MTTISSKKILFIGDVHDEYSIMKRAISNMCRVNSPPKGYKDESDS